MAGMLSSVHRRGPHETHVELPFGEKPKGVLGSFGSGFVAVEHQVDSVDAELFGEAEDFFALGFGHSVGHERQGWDAEVVEVDDIV